MFGIGGSHVLFDVMVHVGTLLAMCLVFRHDISQVARAAVQAVPGRATSNPVARSMIPAIVCGTIPTAIIGAGFSGFFRHLFGSMTAAGVGLLMTGVILMSTVWFKIGTYGRDVPAQRTISIVHALIIGTAQGLALAPGISRSGITIAAALVLGIERELAVRFSFLLAIPTIIGALAFAMNDHVFGAEVAAHGMDVPVAAIGMIIAAGAGICALKFLLHIVRRGRIFLFAYYCWIVGFITVSIGILRG
jgi:undecaprenyl-diphosphatase